MCSRIFPTFSSIRFSGTGFMFRSLINLDWSFVQDMDLFSFFCILSPSYTSNICWRYFVLPVVQFWILCKQSVLHRCVDLCRGLWIDTIERSGWRGAGWGENWKRWLDRGRILWSDINLMQENSHESTRITPCKTSCDSGWVVWTRYLLWSDWWLSQYSSENLHPVTDEKLMQIPTVKN